MTNYEAIRKIEIAISEVEWEYPMDYAEAFDVAVKAIEKADKYGWHDLRKDPYDLPEERGQNGTFCKSVMVAIRSYDEKTVIVGYGWWNDYLGHVYAIFGDSDVCTTVEDRVIAWKNIDPFEE